MSYLGSPVFPQCQFCHVCVHVVVVILSIGAHRSSIILICTPFLTRVVCIFVYRKEVAIAFLIIFEGGAH